MKRRKGFSILMALLLALSVCIAPVTAKEVTTPYSKEDASISLSVYNADKTTDGKGNILVKDNSKDFGTVGNYFKLEAVPDTGYDFTKWEVDVSLKMRDGTVTSKGSQYSFTESATGKTGYAFENGEGTGVYSKNSPTLRVKRINTEGLGDVEKILYTVEAYFAPQSGESQNTQPQGGTPSPTGTEVPDPSDAPQPPQVSSSQPVDVAVNYLYNGRVVLSGTSQHYTEAGTKTVTADSDMLRNYGFALADSGDNTRSIQVEDNGSGSLAASPATADFELTPTIDPTGYSFEVNYKDRDGDLVGEKQTVAFQKTGGFDINDIPVPQGYHRVESQGVGTDPQYPVSLDFTGQGWEPVPSAVTLTVEADASAKVEVRYVLEDGTVLNTYQQVYDTEGQQVLTADPLDRYEFVDSNQVDIQVSKDSQGNLIAQPDAVDFKVKPAAALEPVRVKVKYLYGSTEISTYEESFDKEGTHTVKADALRYEDKGYQLDDRQSLEQTVVVTKGGDGKLKAEPGELSFAVVPTVDPTTVTFQLVYVHAGSDSVIKEVTSHFNGLEPIYYKDISVVEGYRLSLSGGVDENDVATSLEFDTDAQEWKAVPDRVEVPVVQNFAEVVIEFQLKDGTVVKSYTHPDKFIEIGSEVVEVQAPAGYDLLESKKKTIEISADSNGQLVAHPFKLIYKVEPNVKPSDISFQVTYVNPMGKKTGQTKTMHFTSFGKFSGDKIPIPDGWQRVAPSNPTDAYKYPTSLVLKEGKWQADPAEIEVMIQKLATVTVNYALEGGSVLSGYSTSVTYNDQGKKTITAKVPSGYQLVGSKDQTVTVGTDSDGNLLANPTKVTFKVKKITAATKTNKKGTPKTGDQSPILFYSLLGAVALVGAGGVVVYRKKRLRK